MIRAFVAIELPETVAADLIAAQAGLPEGRPVPPENLHLTLAFLGEHPEPVVEDAHHALSRLRHRSFELTLRGLDVLGDRRLRVLNAGVAPEPGLDRLQSKVAQAIRDAGVELQRRRFQPHVTLARMGGGLTGDAAARLRAFAVRGAGFRSGPFAVTRFALIRSHLGRAGSIYEVLARYELTPSTAEAAL